MKKYKFIKFNANLSKSEKDFNDKIEHLFNDDSNYMFWALKNSGDGLIRTAIQQYLEENVPGFLEKIDNFLENYASSHFNIGFGGYSPKQSWENTKIGLYPRMNDDFNISLVFSLSIWVFNAKPGDQMDDQTVIQYAEDFINGIKSEINKIPFFSNWKINSTPIQGSKDIDRSKSMVEGYCGVELISPNNIKVDKLFLPKILNYAQETRQRKEYQDFEDAQKQKQNKKEKKNNDYINNIKSTLNSVTSLTKINNIIKTHIEEVSEDDLLNSFFPAAQNTNEMKNATTAVESSWSTKGTIIDSGFKQSYDSGYGPSLKFYIALQAKTATYLIMYDLYNADDSKIEKPSKANISNMKFDTKEKCLNFIKNVAPEDWMDEFDVNGELGSSPIIKEAMTVIEALQYLNHID